MNDKKASDFWEILDRICYKIFINCLGFIGLTCLLFGWIFIPWSIGHFIRLEVKEGFLALALFLLSVVISRGSNKLYEKLGIGNNK